MFKKSVPPLSNGLSASSREDHQFRIVLWGPPDSGKTWFLEAFVTWLWNYNQAENKLARFELNDMGGLEIHSRLAESDPMEFARLNVSMKDMVGYLTRYNLADHSGKAPAAKLSSYTHYLHITDEKGHSALELLNDTWKVRPTELSFERANGVIIAIDTAWLLQESAGENSKSSEKMGEDSSGKSAQLYNTWIRQLLEKLCNEPARPAKRYIALCLMKADASPSTLDDPWMQLETLLGKELLETLGGYKNQRDIHIEAFACSAAGYLEEADKKPNISKGRLSNPEKWAPWNVATPVFWMLEEVERQRLLSNGNNICRFFFRTTRQSLYIPYPKSPEA
jgi:GTPase SAR1 family protein